MNIKPNDKLYKIFFTPRDFAFSFHEGGEIEQNSGMDRESFYEYIDDLVEEMEKSYEDFGFMYIDDTDADYFMNFIDIAVDHYTDYNKYCIETYDDNVDLQTICELKDTFKDCKLNVMPYVCIVKYDFGQDEVTIEQPVKDHNEGENFAYEVLDREELSDLVYAVVERGQHWEDAEDITGIGL